MPEALWEAGRSYMERVNFDTFAENYDQVHNKSITIAGEESVFFTELKIKLLHTYFGPNSKSHVLDYGCGTGRAASFFHQYFPTIKYDGCDLSTESIQHAQTQLQNNPQNNSQNNPHQNSLNNHHNDTFFVVGSEPLVQKYDLIMAAVVFHHIPPDERHNILKQLHSSLYDGGHLVIFEHNPHNPLTRKVVHDCPFDKDAILLTPNEAKKIMVEACFTIEKLQYYFFYPKFLSFLRPTEKILSKVPLGAQYMLVLRK